jgi:hypothetical protein
MMFKAYKYRLYPNKEQERKLNETLPRSGEFEVVSHVFRSQE